MKTEDKDWRNYKIEAEETELLESIERGEWKSIGNIDERRQALRNFFSDKTDTVNNLILILPKEDYESLMQKSRQYGIHYQEIIQKLIHQFAQGKVLL